MAIKSKAVVAPVVEVKAEEVKAEEVKAEEVKVEVKRVGIGSTIVEMILANPEKANKDILAEILAKFGNAKTTYACIAWYRSDLRKKGLIGPRVFAKKAQPVAVKA